MRTVILSSVAAAALSCALAVQVPFASSKPWEIGRQPEVTPTTSGEDLKGWSLDDLPSPNSTDHLVFETVHSLLQQWPNTRMRNGHSIVPGVIPKGTLLYHGAPEKELPKVPEWTATDPEHSYLFCRSLFNSSQHGGWLLTLMANRPLKVIYFDGSSAVKIPFGSMDTQDLITWGKPSTSKNMTAEEAKRIRDLCDWGRNLGVDGFVRMQMDFEIMLCDFTSGVNVVSFEHLASQWSGPYMVSSYELFEAINSGTWHNRFPGETRIQLDLSGLVSFYDTQLVPSLIPIRVGQERWDHRAINISTEDLAAVKSALETNLMRPTGASTGIDWKTLIQVIVDRYAQRLELTRYLLSSSGSNDEVLDLAKKTQAQLRIMLTPYLLFSALPTDPSNTTETAWAIPIYELCSTIHTHQIESQFESLTNSEELILRAVRGTSREICRVVTKMWTAGVYAGLDPSLNTKEHHKVAEIARLRETWAAELNDLMIWLDWSVWVQCNPACGVEETCYLPTWPIGFPWFATFPPPFPIPMEGDDNYMPRPEGLADMSSEAAIKPGPDEWKRPQPKCIRRVKPYKF